jgi:uncharacterized protein (DUF169 family)
MPTIEEYNRCGEDLEKILLLRTSPIAVKMLEKEEDIPEGAIRPKKDRGYHLAQCQVFAMSRRRGESIAMLKEDNWCWAPPMGFGLVENPNDPFIDSHAYFPCFEFGKYVGIVSAPLKTANFEPDVVLIYCNNVQLRNLVSIVKYREKTLVSSEFDPIDSCVYSIVPVMLTGQYRITLPDPGEYERAMADEDEIIFSVPKDKLEGLVDGLKETASRTGGTIRQPRDLMPDFPRPKFYTELFKKWGLDTED